ncbi:aldehyde dehydrogenase (plasmid) [Rhodococcus opacus]|uniref:aldehyde dehydrogenase (NAD(+)) n=3 Tax=Rhodococcus TaxID=1827 RepID=A0A076F0W1_RHOOP|nr:aldehyde dehydrogenase [Rhodococcus sp. TFB]AII11057.1 aldehyde dehydrogenase [Rhodococcus opacus]
MAPRLHRDAFYIGGEWRTPATTERLAVENPATEEIIGSVPVSGPDEVNLAVAAAGSAASEWGLSTADERIFVLRQIAELVKASAPELAVLVSDEIGTPITFAEQVQLGLPIAVLESHIRLLEEGALDDERMGTSLVTKAPMGVAVAITPWNYPLHQLIGKVAPAIAAGCTTIVKPSALAPLSTFSLFELFDASDLPPGVVNLVFGPGAAVGELLVSHPDVDMVSFTGSTRAGRRVAELAGTGLKKVTLELGGKSASIILDDADLDSAVKATVAKAYQNGGQTCSAWTRLLVPDRLYDEVLERVVTEAESFVPGDPREPATKLGPLASADQRRQVLDYIRKGEAEGAKVVAGGAYDVPGMTRGHYVPATVLTDVVPDATVAQEEIFGPVLSVLRYENDDDAVAVANNSRYGLAGAVWSVDVDRASRVARRLATGRVDINGAAFNTLAPFGGFKDSGFGRELGRYGLEEYLQPRSLQL